MTTKPTAEQIIMATIGRVNYPYVPANVDVERVLQFAQADQDGSGVSRVGAYTGTAEQRAAIRALMQPATPAVPKMPEIIPDAGEIKDLALSKGGRIAIGTVAAAAAIVAVGVAIRA